MLACGPLARDCVPITCLARCLSNGLPEEAINGVPNASSVSDVERAVYRSIQSSARRHQAMVLALGGVADHVHLLIALPATVTIAALMQDVKGVSSHVARRARGDEGFFRWQHGFGAYSVDDCRALRVVA